jgi:hypothetical protein
MVFSVSDAVRIATDAHDGQIDKSGKPYIGHPVRVMNRVEGRANPTCGSCPTPAPASSTATLRVDKAADGTHSYQLDYEV